MKKLLKKFKSHILLFSIVLGLPTILSYSLVKSETWHRKFIRATVGPSVVRVVDPVLMMSGGTGFHVKAKSGKVYILTNHHVCRVAGDSVAPGSVVGVFSSKNALYYKKVVAIYPSSDLCLIEPLSSTSGLSVSTQPEKSDELTVVGHPFLQPLTVEHGEYVATRYEELEWGLDLNDDLCKGASFRNEDIPLKDRKDFHGAKKVCIRTVNTMLTTIPSLPGNSGSPVVDVWGNVVGVLFSGMYPTNWAGVIPTEDVTEFLSKY